MQRTHIQSKMRLWKLQSTAQTVLFTAAKIAVFPRRSMDCMQSSTFLETANSITAAKARFPTETTNLLVPSATVPDAPRPVNARKSVGCAKGLFLKDAENPSFFSAYVTIAEAYGTERKKSAILFVLDLVTRR